MNLPEEIERLKKLKIEIDESILRQKDESAKIKKTIKKLEKLNGMANDLIDEIPTLPTLIYDPELQLANAPHVLPNYINSPHGLPEAS